MGKFRVLVREVHISHIEVEATSSEQALAYVRANGTDFGTEVFCEYSHTLDPENWTVEKSEKNEK